MMEEDKKEFKGQMYVRPCMRGLCFGPDLEDLETILKLEDNCYYEVEITVRAIKKNEK